MPGDLSIAAGVEMALARGEDGHALAFLVGWLSGTKDAEQSARIDAAWRARQGRKA